MQNEVCTVTGSFDSENPYLGHLKIFYCKEFFCMSPLCSTCLNYPLSLAEPPHHLVSLNCSLIHSSSAWILSSFFLSSSQLPHFSICYKKDATASL